MLERKLFVIELMLRRKLGSRWFWKPAARDCFRGNLLRRDQILFHEYRRDRKDVADVIESVAGIVGRKIVRRLELDSQKVADCVVVFGAVEAMSGEMAGI